MIGDAARLRQVLLNLAGNAIKFTEHGGVAVVAEAGNRPGEIAILVRDTGIGIAPEAQTRIFREFEQGDSGPARKFGGTGLGLAISNAIVTTMGGRIDVDSSLGTGATFRVGLPLRAACPLAPSVARRLRRLPAPRILVAAPAAVEAPLLTRRLSQWGVQVTAVADEQAAMASR